MTDVSFDVYRDKDARKASYNLSEVVGVQRKPAEDGLEELTLRFMDGVERRHLVMPKTAIYVCEVFANKAS